LARHSGAELLWRCTKNRVLPRDVELPDGSFLSEIKPTTGTPAQRQEQAQVVRVIEYAMPGVPGTEPSYRLLTTLLDPKQAPALELAALYHERWQVEEVFDELKTHLVRGRRVLRSKTADLVRQEFYGWVMAHYAVRWLMHQGATRHRMPHQELSFASHIQLLKREQPLSGAFPPREAAIASNRMAKGARRKRPTEGHANAEPTKPAHGQAKKLAVRTA
jgi:Transposase DDE domain